MDRGFHPTKPVFVLVLGLIFVQRSLGITGHLAGDEDERGPPRPLRLHAFGGRSRPVPLDGILGDRRRFRAGFLASPGPHGDCLGPDSRGHRVPSDLSGLNPRLTGRRCIFGTMEDLFGEFLRGFLQGLRFAGNFALQGVLFFLV